MKFAQNLQIFNTCDHSEEEIEKMMTSDHYLGKNMDRIVINLADVKSVAAENSEYGHYYRYNQ